MKKTKFSAIDILIVIFLAVIIVFGFIKVGNFDLKDIDFLNLTENKKTATVRFSVLSTYVDDGTGDMVSVGDKLTLNYFEKTTAVVKRVSETRHVENIFNPYQGKYIEQEIDDKSDLMIELECTVDDVDTAFLNDEVTIRVGEGVYLHGKGFTIFGWIVTVDEVD